MNALLLYAHPNPRSFNRAIRDRVLWVLAEEGHGVRVKDLYAMDFQPVLSAQDLASLKTGDVPADIAREQQDILWADVLILVYPIWWFGLPAILKGWFDRVFQEGFAFRYQEGQLEGLLGPRRALIIHTTGGDEASHQRMGAHDLIARPLTDGTLAFCGFAETRYQTLFGVPVISQQQREEMLEEVDELVRGFMLGDAIPAP